MRKMITLAAIGLFLTLGTAIAADKEVEKAQAVSGFPTSLGESSLDSHTIFSVGPDVLRGLNPFFFRVVSEGVCFGPANNTVYGGNMLMDRFPALYEESRSNNAVILKVVTVPSSMDPNCAAIWVTYFTNKG